MTLASYASSAEAQPIIPPALTHENALIESSKSDAIVYSFVSMIRDKLRWYLDIIRTILRCSILTCLFIPPAVAAPLLALRISELDEWWWTILRNSICAAGPCFVKFAQWAAMRADLFHARICTELSKLQAGATIHSWKYTESILSHVIGPQWKEIVSIQPGGLIGSGCVAQVYRGELLVGSSKQEKQWTERQPVAIKILHPGVRSSMEQDLNLMAAVASMVESVGGFLLRWFDTSSRNTIAKKFRCAAVHKSNESEIVEIIEAPLVCVNLSESVAEFRHFMQQQLDLTNEAKSLIRLRHNFSGTNWKDRVAIPVPVSSTTDADDDDVGGVRKQSNTTSSFQSHPDVLIETYYDAMPMTQVLDDVAVSNFNRKTGANRGRNGIYNKEAVSVSAVGMSPNQREANREIAKLGLDIILKMLFEDNFIHADLHGGNILVQNYPKTANPHMEPHRRMLPVPSPKAAATAPPSLVLLDAGLTIELSPYDRQNFIALFKAVVENDGALAARLMMEYAPTSTTTTTGSVTTPPTTTAIQQSGATALSGDATSSSALALVRSPDIFEREMAHLVDSVHKQGLQLGTISVGQLLSRVLSLSYAHRVKLESRFVSVVVAIMLAEGMGRQLDPEVDIITRAAPHIRNAALDLLLSRKATSSTSVTK